MLGLTATALMGSSAAKAQDIFIEVHNMQVVSGGPTPSMTFDVYISASQNYVNTVMLPANNTPAHPASLNNLDIAFDVDFGTGGGVAPAPNMPLGYAAGTSLLTFNISGITPVANSVIPSGLSGPMPAGYDSRFKMNMDRTTVNNEISLTPVKAFTIQVNFPAGILIDQSTGTIRLRTITGGYGSKWGSNDAVVGFNSPIGASLTQVQPLPVSLTDFSALKASDGVRSQLNWTTLTETGSSYFEVERSAVNEAASFSSIGVKVAAAGSSATKLTYQSYDRSPLSGANWYRLRMVDLSGRVGYSAAKLVRFDGRGGAGEAVTFGPNPLTRSNVSQSVLRVDASADQRVSYTISDAGGKLVGGGELEVLKGVGSYGVSGLESLAAGTYYLNAKGATISQTIKISKSE